MTGRGTGTLRHRMDLRYNLIRSDRLWSLEDALHSRENPRPQYGKLVITSKAFLTNILRLVNFFARNARISH